MMTLTQRRTKQLANGWCFAQSLQRLSQLTVKYNNNNSEIHIRWPYPKRQSCIAEKALTLPLLMFHRRRIVELPCVGIKDELDLS